MSKCFGTMSGCYKADECDHLYDYYISVAHRAVGLFSPFLPIFMLVLIAIGIMFDCKENEKEKKRMIDVINFIGEQRAERKKKEKESGSDDIDTVHRIFKKYEGDKTKREQLYDIFKDSKKQVEEDDQRMFNRSINRDKPLKLVNCRYCRMRISLGQKQVIKVPEHLSGYGSDVEKGVNRYCCDGDCYMKYAEACDTMDWTIPKINQ